MFAWQCCLLHLCNLFSVMAVFTSLLPNPKDPLWGLLEGDTASLFFVSGEGAVTTDPVAGFLAVFAGSGSRTLGQRGSHTGSLYLGLTDGYIGRQSTFRAIKYLYSMKGAGKMMLPHENKVKRPTLICHRPGQNKLFFLIQWTWMELKSSVVYRLPW